MATDSTLRFSAQTDEVTSLLRIVNLVRTGEATTRPEIGDATGLGRGVVTQRIERATALGYLVDSDFGPSSGGRAPRTLRFQAERGRLVICAIGALHIHVGLTELDGDVTAQAHRDWDISRGPDETIGVALAMVDELLAEHPGAPIWGVGVGLPGPVDFASGRPVAPPIMPGWNNVDVRGRIHAHLGAPTWVDNDVNLLTYGERARRHAVDGDLIYCKVGSGIGAGLLSGGRVHRGANGAAGDIGHVPVLGAETRCRCGKVGCLEAVASGWALVRDVNAAIAAGEETSLAEVDPLTPEQISLAAERGDGLAWKLSQTSARVVGDAIATLVNMFNPSVIVIGGAVAGVAGETYLAEVRQRVYERSLPLATRDLRIEQSLNDVREPIRGGAELLRERLFDASFARWFADGRPTIEAIFPEG
ncbi:ROK family protein [Microbacterium sp. G2-8]|uniref:ROK family protein n=1 Tax=Microbacterium sp. G2-8 TaxID=2842454 RepID=UPI001C8984BC|nr:ROK family protein [Microbacterium sp. G2-8]